MTWFESYLIWTLTPIVTLFGVMAVVSIVIGIIAFITASVCIDDEVFYRICKIAVAVFIPCVLIATLTPSTEQLFKMWATKAVVELSQTERVQTIGDKTGKAVENALDLLNQTIEDKLQTAKGKK